MTLHIGIAPASHVKKRMIEIARGGKPLPGEPRVWVSSLEVFGQGAHREEHAALGDDQALTAPIFG